jgi:hypothetical protein
MANILLFDAPHLELGTIQAEIACTIWRKRNRIELLKALAPAIATVNPEKAQEYVQSLLEEIEPQLKIEKAESEAKLRNMVEQEAKNVYTVTPIAGTPGLRKRPAGRRRR